MQLKGFSETNSTLRYKKMPPKGILATRKQQCFSSSDNLADRSIRGETGRQTEIKASPGRAYRRCRGRAGCTLEPWSQGATQGGRRDLRTCACTAAALRHRAAPAAAARQSLPGRGGQSTALLTSPFSKGPFLRPLPTSPFPQ